METFLRDVEAKLAGLSPADREVQIARLVQLFQAVQYMRQFFDFKGGGRMTAWLAEQIIAQVPQARVFQKIRDKASILKLENVLRVINTAAAS